MTAICGVHHEDNRVSKLVALNLNKTIGYLAMENNVYWYGHVLSRQMGYVLRSV